MNHISVFASPFSSLSTIGANTCAGVHVIYTGDYHTLRSELKTAVRPMLTIGRLPYELAVAGVIASANGRRRLLRAVTNLSSLAVRTTTICS